MSYTIPTEIEIGGRNFHITDDGDFRMVLDCFSLLNDKDIPEEYRALFCLIIFYEDVFDVESLDNVFGDNVGEAVQKMFAFFNCNQSEETGLNMGIKLMDWEQDEQLICAAVNLVAQAEIRSVLFLHWFTFRGYLNEVPESTWSRVVAIRFKKARGKKLDNAEKEFVRYNPQYFTSKEDIEAQKDAEAWLESVWNKS